MLKILCQPARKLHLNNEVRTLSPKPKLLLKPLSLNWRVLSQPYPWVAYHLWDEWLYLEAVANGLINPFLPTIWGSSLSVCQMSTDIYRPAEVRCVAYSLTPDFSGCSCLLSQPGAPSHQTVAGCCWVWHVQTSPQEFCTCGSDCSDIGEKPRPWRLPFANLLPLTSLTLLLISIIKGKRVVVCLTMQKWRHLGCFNLCSCLSSITPRSQFET